MSSRALLLLLALASCAPVTNVDGDTDTTNGDPDLLAASGRLYAEPMSLVWGWNTSEVADGVCLDLKIATNGAAVRAWRLDVTTDIAVDELFYVTGAQVRATTDGFSVAPSVEPELAGGEEVLARFCSRPGVRPLEMVATVQYFDDVDTDLAAASDPYGVLLDPGSDFLVKFEDDGVENGGRCLRVQVSNITAVPVVDWGLEFTMAAAVASTASEGLLFYEGDRPDRLVVIPDADSRTIQPFDFEEGRVCLLPFAEPIAVRSGDAPTP